MPTAATHGLTFLRATTPPIDLDDPLALPDQDALNALLMTVVDPTRIAIQPAAASAQGRWELARVRLHGTCGGCPSTVLAVILGIEQDLRRHVPEIEYVEAVP